MQFGVRHLNPVRVALALLVGMASLAGNPAQAQEKYPAKPVHVVVPHPAGGPADLLGRIAATELGKSFSQTFYVENKPGGGGLLGAGQVARSKPDGYTILANASTHVIAPAIFPNIDFDAIQDFTPITQLIRVPHILVVNPELPVHSVQELVAYIKANPGKTSFASSGNGGAHHLAGELFKQLAGVDVLHIPFRGSAPALTAVMGGQVTMMFETASTALASIKAGKVRALAITSAERSKIAPDLPTMAEAGVKGYELTNWYGLWAPKGVSPEITQEIVERLREAFKRPDLQQQISGLAADAVLSSPDDFAKFCVAEKKKWAEVVAKSGAKLD